MGETRSGIWDVWLAGLTTGVALAGFLLAAFPSSGPVNVLINGHADPVFWPDGGPTPSMVAYRSWVFGVTGAVMGGWGMLMVWVARGPFLRREPWAWLALALPVSCWYVADTLASVARGVVSNAILNTGLLVLFLPPLSATAREFLRPRT